VSKHTLWLTLAVLGLTAALFWPAWGRTQPGATPAGGTRYTIVNTEGTNLLVVDNSTNTVYYYTVDPGKAVGDDLKLRGTIDLTEVGKPVIKPKVAK
jgi:hypothetical protein